MEWDYNLPKKEGKYVVQTKTSFGSSNTLKSYFNGKKWSFTNQLFYRYLKEDENESRIK